MLFLIQQQTAVRNLKLKCCCRIPNNFVADYLTMILVNWTHNRVAVYSAVVYVFKDHFPQMIPD